MREEKYFELSFRNPPANRQEAVSRCITTKNWQNQNLYGQGRGADRITKRQEQQEKQECENKCYSQFETCPAPGGTPTKHQCSQLSGVPMCAIPKERGEGGGVCEVYVNPEKWEVYNKCMNPDYVPEVPNDMPWGEDDFVELDDTREVKTAGFVGSNLLMILIVGGFVYYAHSQGWLKK